MLIVAWRTAGRVISCKTCPDAVYHALPPGGNILTLNLSAEYCNTAMPTYCQYASHTQSVTGNR